jgi:hypothetical protein
VPKLSFNLLSVGKLLELGYRLVFYSSCVYVQDPQTGQTLGNGCKVRPLFELSSLHISISKVSVVASSSPPSLARWHSRLSHASVFQVQVLASKGLLGSVSNGSFDCISSQLRKQLALRFNNSESIASTSFDLIHSDVWRPSHVPSMSGSRYFVIFVDDYSCYTSMFLMKSHSEFFDIYHNFTKMVET